VAGRRQHERAIEVGAAAALYERAFDHLDAPVEGVTGADVPMPYARNLELLALPHEAEVVAAARRALYREA
jgi:pyruvate dehydrogenase E1 component beta subunit